MDTDTPHPVHTRYIVAALLIAAAVFVGGMYFYYPEFFSKVFPLKKTETVKSEIEWQELAADLIKTKDFTQCEKIFDTTYQTVCVNNIALNLAQETGDISYCAKIDNKLVPRSDCERQIVFTQSIEREDIAVCGQTQNQELQDQCRESFYPALALRKGDITICGRITDQARANLCHDSFLINKDLPQDPQKFDCSSLNSVDARNDCEKVKTIKRTSTPMCGDLKTGLFVPYCLSVSRF